MLTETERKNFITKTLFQNKTAGLSVVMFLSIILFTLSFMINGQFKSLGETIRGIMIGNEDKSGTSLSSHTIPEESVFADQLKPILTDPVMIKIESLNIEAEVIRVGVDGDGVMETPGSWEQVGWYRNSSKPGEQGNFILNGHFDTSYGTPAVFWQLKNIQVGDKVTVIDKYGRFYTYLTKESFYVDINDPNRLNVLKSEESVNTMTLITCGGVWVPGVSTYNKRLIVKAELVDH